MTKYLDPPHVRRITVTVDQNSIDVPLPLVVEIEVNSRCNRKCSYCPVSLEPTPPVPRTMTREVFDRAIAELASFSFDGRLSYHFYSEPLLRRDLADLVSYADQWLPSACQVLYTNGDLLDDKRHKELSEAGIDRFVVTQHDSAPFVERENQTVLRPKDLAITNRGGSLSSIGTPLMLRCVVPMELMVISVTGDILPCYEDFVRHHHIGNIMSAPLLEIWASDYLERLRRLLNVGRRKDGAEICQRCNNRAHSEDFSTWFAV